MRGVGEPRSRKWFLAALVLFWCVWFGVVYRGIEIPRPHFCVGGVECFVVVGLVYFFCYDEGCLDLIFLLLVVW